MGARSSTATIIRSRRDALRAIRRAEMETDSSLEKLERHLFRLMSLKNRIPTTEDLQVVLEEAIDADNKMNNLVDKIKGTMNVFGIL
jgi:hypothetical protein